MDVSSDRFDLIDSKMKGKFQEELLRRRKAGASWRDLEYWIYETTGIKVSFETVRAWHRALTEDVAV